MQGWRVHSTTFAKEQIQQDGTIHLLAVWELSAIV
jgi:hypothetical protein